MNELSTLSEIKAIAVSGSIAAGNADFFSDLDLQCVFDEVTAPIANAVHELVHRLVQVGDDRWTSPDRILSVVSVDWLRIDLSLFDASWPLSELSIVVWPDPSLRVPRSPVPSLQPDARRLSDTVGRFLRSLGLIVRDLERGDLRLGCFATEFLVEELIELMYWQRGLVRGAQKGTYAQLPNSDVRVLQSLPVAEPNRESIIDGHLAVAAEYLGRAKQLAITWGAEWPEAMAAGTRSFLLTHGQTFGEELTHPGPDKTSHGSRHTRADVRF